MDTMVAEVAEVAETTTTKNQKRQYGDFSHPDFEFSNKGISNLFAGEFGVIRMAVDDAKTLTKAGVLVDGHLAVTEMPGRHCEGMTLPEVKELLVSLEDKNLGLLLTFGNINIKPKKIRRKLGFSW